MRTSDQVLLNAVQRPDVYREVVLRDGAAVCVLSVWQGEPGRPVVLFLPGTMTHPLFYEELLDALSRHGHTAVGLHFRGHGKSPRGAVDLTVDGLLQDAAAAVTWCRAGYPDAPLVVLGSSQGGALAIALAARDHRVDAVFAHNLLDPRLPASLAVTRFASLPDAAYRLVPPAVRLAARLAPRLPVPLEAYLDIDRVCGTRTSAERFYSDPLGLRAYPLEFMASLLAADLSGMHDGSITCPVTVVAGRGDPLFPLWYTEQVYARVVAPRTELLVIESDAHLLFNEDLAAVLPPLLDRLAGVAEEYRGRGAARSS